MKVTLLQMDTVWQDRAANFASVEKMVRTLDPTDLIVLPELFAVGFTNTPRPFAEAENGETAELLSRLATDRRCTVIGGLIAADLDGGLPRNTLAVFAPDGTLRATYAKIHPFSFGGEHLCYGAGDEPRCVDMEETGFCLGLSICYDLRFPELYRLLVGMGATVLVVTANWPKSRVEHWRTLLRARAIENQCFVLGVNRVGEGGGLEYNGNTLIVGPKGEILGDAGEREGCVEAELDLERLQTWRQGFPALADRRL